MGQTLLTPIRWRHRVGLLLAALLMATAADARVRWSTPGSYRFRLIQLADVTLDETGTTNDRALWGQHRLRIDPTIHAGPVRVFMELDVLTGQIFGDTTSVGAAFVERRHGDPERDADGWTTVEPRMLWVQWGGEWGYLQAGQMGAHWGLGLLDDDGHDRRPAERLFVEPLGDRINGDLVDRAAVMVQPLALVSQRAIRALLIGGGADFIWQDDEASFLDGDRAWRAFGAIRYPGEEFDGGLYVVHREQTDADDDRLSTTSFDVYGTWRVPLYRLGADLRLQGEAVLALGSTDRQRAAGSAADSDILQLGWVARADFALRCPRIATALEVGYASGDADPADGTLRAFTFDPDHRVGLVLFPDVLRLVTLRGAERIADPVRVGRPPGGAEQLPTDGAVRNAIYVHPAVTWRPGAWRLTTALLLAWAAEPFLDPYRTLEAGGIARNHLDQPGERFYGTEISGGAQYTLEFQGVLDALALGAQGGVLLPGAALSGPAGDGPIYKVVGRVDLRWH